MRLRNHFQSKPATAQSLFKINPEEWKAWRSQLAYWKDQLNVMQNLIQRYYDKGLNDEQYAAVKHHHQTLCDLREELQVLQRKLAYETIVSTTGEPLGTAMPQAKKRILISWLNSFEHNFKNLRKNLFQTFRAVMRYG